MLYETPSFMRPFSGILREFRLRLPLYADDWKQGLHPKVLASAVFMYFTSVAPAITFAATLDNDTGRHVGAVEVLLSSAICGCIFSIFAGQPLVIVGMTV